MLAIFACGASYRHHIIQRHLRCVMSVSLLRVSLTWPSDLIARLDAAAEASDYRTRSAFSAKLLRDALGNSHADASVILCSEACAPGSDATHRRAGAAISDPGAACQIAAPVDCASVGAPVADGARLPAHPATASFANSTVVVPGSGGNPPSVAPEALRAARGRATIHTDDN